MQIRFFADGKACPRCGTYTVRVRKPIWLRWLNPLLRGRYTYRECPSCYHWEGLARSKSRRRPRRTSREWETAQDTGPIIILSAEPQWAAESAAKLMGAGYHVAIVSTTDAALKVADSLQPQLFLLDSPTGAFNGYNGADLRSKTRIPLAVVGAEDDDQPRASDARQDGRREGPPMIARERLVESVGRATARRPLVSA